ncbi:MAG: helix-turn-helix domain-containing protein [Candidatus Paceibacterota bacterium]
MLEKNLQNLGMSEKEAKVYLALLQVDSASATELSRTTDIKRPTVYVIIESLAEKGLVSETTVGKRTQFQAESPERLETYVERRKQELNEQSKELKSDVIPQLRSMQRGTGERPVVKYYEGHEGVLSILDEFSRSESEDKMLHILFPFDMLQEKFTKQERDRYRQIRLDRGVSARAVYTSKEKNVLPKQEKSEAVWLDASKYPIQCDVGVFGDKVRVSILGDTVSGVYIQSPEFAETIRSLINFVYDTKKKSAAGEEE